MGENHEGPELPFLPPQATGLSLRPQEWVQGARGAAGADGDDGEGMCLQGWHAGVGVLVGQGCWDLTAPSPGTPGCGGLLSSVHLLSPGLLWHTAWLPVQLWSAALPSSLPRWVSQDTTGQDGKSPPGPRLSCRCSAIE